VQSYFRIHPGDEDPERLLHPEEQQSRPWDGGGRGPCDKCDGSGRTTHECESCKAGGRDEDCPSCQGRLRYEDACPACEGSGEIDESSREGVSVFPDEDGLYRYMLKRDAELEGCMLVELAGEPTGEEDFDADEGALLVRPTRILARREPDWDAIRRLERSVS